MGLTKGMSMYSRGLLRTAALGIGVAVASIFAGGCVTYDDDYYHGYYGGPYYYHEYGGWPYWRHDRFRGDFDRDRFHDLHEFHEHLEHEFHH